MLQKEIYLADLEPTKGKEQKGKRPVVLISGNTMNENFDVIHAHDWLSFPAGVAAKNATGKPLVVHIHSTEIDRTGGNNANEAIYAVEKAGMEAADTVIAVSNFTKQRIIMGR